MKFEHLLFDDFDVFEKKHGMITRLYKHKVTLGKVLDFSVENNTTIHDIESENILKQEIVTADKHTMLQGKMHLCN